jgi:hypothetical protein
MSKKSTHKKNKLKPFDVVALLRSIPEKKLIVGQVGTVVEILDENVYEVEFANRKGETLVTLPLRKKDIMLLHYEMEFA